MRYGQSEKTEVIRIVEGSGLGVKQTLREFGINRSTFYEWYWRYQEEGYDGLAARKPTGWRFWNAIPSWEREKVVETALDHPEKSPRELAWMITDKRGYYISESSVYRILKAYDLISTPAFTVLSASDRFAQPTSRVNELWQTDFTYLKVIHMTQGKIERYHRSMKGVITLDNYYGPEALEREIASLVDHYNNERYHESLGNVTPADVYHGRLDEVLRRRERIKRQTISRRRRLYRNAVTAGV